MSKNSKHSFKIVLLSSCSEISENSQKNIPIGADICSITQHKLHHTRFSGNLLKISENLRAAISQNFKKAWWNEICETKKKQKKNKTKNTSLEI